MTDERLPSERGFGEPAACIDELTRRADELLFEIEHLRLVVVGQIERRELGPFADAREADARRLPPHDDVVAGARAIERGAKRDARVVPRDGELGDVLFVEALRLELHLFAEPAADLGGVHLEPLDDFVDAERVRERVAGGDVEIDDGVQIFERVHVEARDVP